MDSSDDHNSRKRPHPQDGEAGRAKAAKGNAPIRSPSPPEPTAHRRRSQSDVIGLVADLHLRIAGLLWATAYRSVKGDSPFACIMSDLTLDVDVCAMCVQYGTFDQDCMKLAMLCSQAVDYPKNGVPVDRENMPHPLIRAKPDWKKVNMLPLPLPPPWNSD
ncbi:hypothetical protein NUW54_g13105 [Trametes sanguinea]|uniref:Uncharacterized protein n=1 Tax=Trametes sanguinea TaxID=158606 RepID=A0ACC1MPT2_9APHY|nr:hypothetical protein NUW54_g13105 [Trametes sanguinea]